MARLMRTLLAFVVCLLLFLLVVGGGLYYFALGKTAKGSALHQQLEHGLESIVGPKFDVRIDSADLGFDFDGFVGVKSSDIIITRREDGKLLSKIGELTVSLKFWRLLVGELSFDSIYIEEGIINADVLGSGQGLLIPNHLDKPLNAFGSELARFQQQMIGGKLDKFELRNSRVEGKVFGRKELDPLEIESLIFNPKRDGSFVLDGQLSSINSTVNLFATYGSKGEYHRSFDFSATGVNVQEWLQSSNAQKGMIGANGVVDVSGEIPFDRNNTAIEPRLTIISSGGDLRLGLGESAPIKQLELNFRLILSRNQIEMDPSTLELGRLKAQLIGGLKPENESAGYAGPIRFDMIMQRGEFEATIEGEKNELAAVKIAGVLDTSDRILAIDNAFLTTRDGSIKSSGKFVFDGETPSVKATAYSDGISVAAVKQFWPMFISPGARKWVHEHIKGGQLVSGTLEADIPSGILFRMRQGARMEPEHFKLDVQLENTSVQPFGELPFIHDGNGQVKIQGMEISANLDSGVVTDLGDGPANVLSATFRMEDFAAREKVGETTISLDGSLTTIAAITEAKPLRVMERMKVAPEQFKGKAHADIVARFPIRKGVKYEEVDWNVLIDLQDASSSKKLANRIISEADVLIDANSYSASVHGTALIDGVSARINLIEPIGKSGKVSRKRTVTTTLGKAELEKLGLDLNPVVNGPINVRIVQSASEEIHEIDFTNAEVNLPWIGWRKGVGIPAKGKFNLKKNGPNKHLRDFTIQGEGFRADGDLRFDSKGLLSADMSRIVLNEADDFQTTIKREEDVFKINASGLQYDARGIINKIIHEGGFAEEQGKRSVVLLANFDTVTGFGDRSIRDVQLAYESSGGWLKRIDLSGRGNSGVDYIIGAVREGEATTFTILTNDAGNGLAFANIYSRMEGGNLSANLTRTNDGPFLGPVRIVNFDVVNEPRLEKLVSSTNNQVRREKGERVIRLQGSRDQRAKFLVANALIEKGEGYLAVKDGVIRGTSVGLTYAGDVYDAKDRIDLIGTFMPAQGLNMAVSAIPIIGQILSNGNDSGLIGITYRLQGPRTNPKIILNPLSVVAPGIFNKVFEPIR